MDAGSLGRPGSPFLHLARGPDLDFFEHQSVARKATGRLIILFGLAVCGIVLAVYGLFSVLDVAGFATSAEPGARAPAFNLGRLALTAALVAILVGGGSALRMAQLRGGGRVVAESLGGSLLVHGGDSPAEQRLLNIVEEMALASGTPVPPVYVLNASGINAFAAGYSNQDAVVGVTRGALDVLDRDELQGVIAHEFSHIRNGDMRLNLRLIGVLYGIICLSLFGRTLLRAGHVNVSRSRREGSSGVPIFAFGLGLILIGGIGSFFARWIQSAVSRQREYLADASAVQFTRQTDGLVGALSKIEKGVSGSDIDHPRVGEVRHLLFGSPRKSWLSSMFSTHPPLGDRVARLKTGSFKRAQGASGPAPVASSPEGAAKATSGFAGGPASSTPIPLRQEPVVEARREVTEIVDVPGALTQRELSYARELMGTVPRVLHEASESPFGARAVVYGLLLAREDAGLREDQLKRLGEHADPLVAGEVSRILGEVLALDTRARLPVLDLCLGTLRELSPRQYGAFRAILMQLIEADGRTSAFELALRAVVLRQLDPLFGREDLPRRRRVPISARRDEVWVLLSLFAQLSAASSRARVEAFVEASTASSLDLPAQPLELQAASSRLEASLERLRDLAPLEKRKLVIALWRLVLRDGEIHVVEAELFRAVGEILGCPMPPLLAGQPVEVAA